ncbi:multidrug effflux MFS transporter [Pseudochelatococcus contaminans]|uniref:Bcr/CflA family efflux transporter n=1 Tax=Pseudochelatococcus contaminans TaxID=1538103 RepID=A0A7W6EFL9_9HYPH|nr:DHA1 family bicyclomycin/chloramphenicol resistance-like MFS transporter [Pseudochelatococcus contaminans]
MSNKAVRAPGFVEFVVLVALMMALVALSIDNLLPAFVPIQHEFHLASANEVQYMISSYMAGFAISQLFYGPLSDAYGRKPAMLTGMAIYAVGTVLAIAANSFEMLLLARAVQGIGGASSRVLVTAIVRDRYQGEEMARVMSFVMMVFIIGPVIAPGSGALILAIGSWRFIFVSMLVMALVVGFWFALRMPETLRPENRTKASFAGAWNNLRLCLGNPVTMGYTLAMSLVLGSLFGYITSAQQIFETEVYALGGWFPVVFGVVAAVMGVASFVNAWLVRRVGLKRLAWNGTLAFTLTALALVIVVLAWGGPPPLVIFAGFLALLNFFFSLTAPNFNALAMRPMGRMAGTASSFIGAATTALGTLCGVIIGQLYDGTVLPLALGYLVLGLAAAFVVKWTERHDTEDAQPPH